LTEQQCARRVEFAKSVAMKPHHSVSDPNLNLKQAMRRARTVMERLGITQRELARDAARTAPSNTPESAIRSLSGAAPPVAGGGPIDKALDKDARLTVARELGHGRAEITNAYLGKVTKSSTGAAQQERTKTQGDQPAA
jgi:hypothetical protein